MNKANQSIREVVAANLKALMTRRGWTQVVLEEKSTVSQKHISTILKAETDCSTRVLANLAEPFGLESWLLMIPGLDVEKSGDVQRLVDGYSKSSPEDQELLVKMSARGAAHAKQGADEEPPEPPEPPKLPPPRRRLKHA